jgi:hypothetical protein
MSDTQDDADELAREAYETYARALGTDRAAGYRTWDQLPGDRRRAWRAVAARRDAVPDPAGILALAGVTREQLGEQVRDRWITWARIQPDPKPSHLVPYDQLSPADQEADMSIGEDLFCAGWLAGPGRTALPRQQ